MEQTVTIKIKLKLKNPSDADKLVHTMEMFRQASNYIGTIACQVYSLNRKIIYAA